MSVGGVHEPMGFESERLLAIGEVASRFNVTLRALRFYEDRGLIAPRRSGSARFYDEATIRRLELILKGKQLGFTLSEIRQMAGASERESPTAPMLALEPAQLMAQIELLQRQRSDIDRAIGELQATRLRAEQTGSHFATVLPGNEPILASQAA